MTILNLPIKNWIFDLKLLFDFLHFHEIWTQKSANKSENALWNSCSTYILYVCYICLSQKTDLNQLFIIKLVKKNIPEIRIFQPWSIESKRASQKLSFLSFVTVSAAFWSVFPESAADFNDTAVALDNLSGLKSGFDKGRGSSILASRTFWYVAGSRKKIYYYLLSTEFCFINYQLCYLICLANNFLML